MLENTQFALIATVHKLYAMVRNSQTWELGEPELNDRGQPVIHNIASKLGCIRPSSDIDLPVHSIFPEDEAGLAELAAQLEAQQRVRDEQARIKGETDSSGRTDRASSSDLEGSEYEADYKPSSTASFNSAMTMSPQSYAGAYNDFDVNSVQSEMDHHMFPGHSPTVANSGHFPAWNTAAAAAAAAAVMSRPTSMDITPQFLQQSGALLDMDMLSQGLMESEFGTIKPHMLSCPNPEAMMGLGDPMIYSGYDAESLRL